MYFGRNVTEISAIIALRAFSIGIEIHTGVHTSDFNSPLRSFQNRTRDAYRGIADDERRRVGYVGVPRREMRVAKIFMKLFIVAPIFVSEDTFREFDRR